MSGKKSETWKKKRQIDHLPEKTYFYLFSEGTKTEPYYFNGFKECIESNPIYKNMVQIEMHPCGDNTTHVLEIAEKYVSKNKINSGEVWCIYDKDDFPAYRFDAVDDSVSSRHDENSSLKYYAAWSNECLEFWFVLHFENYQSNNHRKDYYKFLDKKFQEFNVGQYKKNEKDIFEILLEHGNPLLAIRYAKRIIDENGKNPPSKIAPGTKVYELVEHLSKFLPDEYKERFIIKDESNNINE